jgi:hypothetical protein
MKPDAMNSRPLLDYLAFPDDFADPAPIEVARETAPVDPLEARLKDLEARLRANQPAPVIPKQDLTLSAQIEAILNRKAALSPPRHGLTAQHADFKPAVPRADAIEAMPHPARVVIDPPPSVPASKDVPMVDQDFHRFTEAVYLIGQAARRFIEEPQAQPQARDAASPETQPVGVAPSTGDIEALSAVLRETVSAFRSVADDLAVSAGEIRHYATRPERQPERPAQRHVERRRSQSSHYRDEDEISELRENIADLQDRLDDLLHARRRTRY